MLWAFVAYLFLTWWLLTHRLDRFWLPLLPTWAILAGLGNSGSAGTGDQNIPAGYRFEAQRSHLANILLVVDDLSELRALSAQLTGL